MSKFKVGDRVRVILPHFTPNAGIIVEKNFFGENLVKMNGGYVWGVYDEGLEKVTPSLTTLVVGDNITNMGGYTLTVLEVWTHSFLAVTKDENETIRIMTFKDAKILNFTVEDSQEKR